MRFSDMTIQKLPPPERGQKFYPDDILSGFGVRVSQGGAKTFLLIVGKERQYITIGRYPIVSLAQAREKARTILAERQQMRTIVAPAKRGDILDRHGRVLATSVDADSIYAVPSEISNAGEATARSAASAAPAGPAAPT